MKARVENNAFQTVFSSERRTVWDNILTGDAQRMADDLIPDLAQAETVVRTG